METRVVFLGLTLPCGVVVKIIDRFILFGIFSGNKKSDDAKEAVAGEELRKQQGHGLGEEWLKS
jgi:hypothetical protein